MKTKKPIYKRWWFWLIVVWLLSGFITLISSCSFLLKSASDFDPNQFTIPTVIESLTETHAEASTDAPTAPPTEEITEPLTEATTEAASTLFDEYVGKPLPELMAKVEELGYTATYLADGADFTEFIDLLAEDYLVGNLSEDPNQKSVIVDLLLKSNAKHEEMEAALKEKLEIGSAWIAVENYGEAEYADFELHYLLGKIEEYAEDENTWFLKAECTVMGLDMICEAKVTGTSDNPQVIYFEVY